MYYSKVEHGSDAFHCPLCSAYAQQSWYFVKIKEVPSFSNSVNPTEEYYSLETEYNLFNPEGYKGLSFSVCRRCLDESIWMNEELIYPFDTIKSTIEPPHSFMPKEVRAIYDEAASVYPLSPRSSTALLRLALEILLPHLGVEGKRIDDMIGQLVRNGSISEITQKAMDSLRVIGNNAVHPGSIETKKDEDSEVAKSLFSLLNYIVSQTIENQKRAEKFYGMLPKGVIESINRRDLKNEEN